MNLDKASAIVPFVGIQERGGEGKASVYITPSSPVYEEGRRGVARFCRVTALADPSARVIRFTCHAFPVDGDGEGVPCLAHGKGWICFHCLASIIASTPGTGRVFFYERAEQQQAEHHATTPPAGMGRGEVRALLVNGDTLAGYAVMFTAVADKDAEITRLQAELAAARGVKPAPQTPIVFPTLAELAAARKATKDTPREEITPPVSRDAFLATLSSPDEGDPPAPVLAPVPVVLEKKKRGKKAV